MANRSGLIALSDGVRAYFVANGVPAVVTPVGWRYRAFQTNQGPGGGSRVCFIPGKLDPTSPGAPKVLDAGSFAPQPRLSGPGAKAGSPMAGVGNPRQLAWWKKIVTISIWAVDTTDTSNDELQYAATEDLVEATYQAMHSAVDPVSGVAVGLANLELVDAVWTLPPVDRAFGRELCAFFIQHGPLFDRTIEYTTPKPNIERGRVLLNNPAAQGGDVEDT